MLPSIKADRQIGITQLLSGACLMLTVAGLGSWGIYWAKAQEAKNQQATNEQLSRDALVRLRSDCVYTKELKRDRTVGGDSRYTEGSVVIDVAEDPANDAYFKDGTCVYNENGQVAFIQAGRTVNILQIIPADIADFKELRRHQPSDPHYITGE